MVFPRFEKKLENFERENQKLKDKINKLEKRLRICENPHTLPSNQRFKKGVGDMNNFSGKCGVPKGHKGASIKT